MMPLALALSPDERSGLETFLQGLVVVFAVICFVRVAVYSVRRMRAGDFFTAASAPPPIAIQPVSGWFFVASVVGLIYLQSVLFAVVVLAGIAVILVENLRPLSVQFGFDRVPPSRALTWAFVVFGAVLLIEEPLVQASSWALDALSVPHPEQEAVDTFRGYTHATEIVQFMLQAVVVMPVIEELFFRGFLVTFLRRYTSTWMAIILSAGVFGFAHLNLGVALPLWFLGIVLGAAYQHTGSLLVPIGIHAFFNLTTALTVLLTKGH